VAPFRDVHGPPIGAVNQGRPGTQVPLLDNDREAQAASGSPWPSSVSCRSASTSTSRASKLTKFVVRKVAVKNTDNTLFSHDFHRIPEVQKVVKKQ
jgi:hypothetical protein